MRLLRGGKGQGSSERFIAECAPVRSDRFQSLFDEWSLTVLPYLIWDGRSLTVPPHGVRSVSTDIQSSKQDGTRSVPCCPPTP